MALYLSALILVSLQRVSAAGLLSLREGESCKALGGRGGSCTLLSKCKDPGDFRRNQPPICTFRGKEPVICCPNAVPEKLRVGFKAAQYCKKLPKIACSSLKRLVKRQTQENNDSNLTLASGTNGNNKGVNVTKPFKPPRRLIYNGRASLPRSQNHMTLIGFGPAEEKEWGCGGSLISSRYILSAAHCANPPLLGEAKWARLGDLDISTDNDDASIQEREIVERILHPGYKEPEVYNDIAIFKLNVPVKFTSWVAPVCLQTEKKIPSEFATVTGWGRVEFAGETSSKLLEADLNVFNDTQCRNLLPFKDNKTPRGIDSDIMLCAGKLDGSKDACSGDSGGPLVISNPDQCVKTQIGVTSYGSQCGLPNSPGVYTRVSAYISWIEELVFINETSQI